MLLLGVAELCDSTLRRKSAADRRKPPTSVSDPDLGDLSNVTAASVALAGDQ